ncbi:MAG: hypothetical protein ABIN80_25045 [Dyadobacter sp.]|uniref:hypothetical protein n=1 Tax=Dyadobacter sp. TaxID=1914288 RepID=UPI003267C6D3
MKLYLIFFLSVLLAACKNKDIISASKFPAELNIVKVNKISIRLFINKMEVKDKDVIDSFIAGDKEFGVSPHAVSGSDKLRFFSADTASINDGNEKVAVTRTQHQFLFTSVKPSYQSLEYFRLIGNMNKYRSELGGPRYDGKYAVQNMMVGYGNYSEIEIRVFNYKLVKAHKGFDYYFGIERLYRSVNAGKVFNEFDEKYVNSLTQTDTLAIEEYSYTFRAK